MLFLGVGHQKYVSELTLAQFLHHLQIFDLQVLGGLDQIGPVVFLELLHLVDGLAFSDGLAQSAAESSDYFFQSSPGYFSRFLHLEVKFEFTVGTFQSLYSIYFCFFRSISDVIVAFSHKEDQIFATVFFLGN